MYPACEGAFSSGHQLEELLVVLTEVTHFPNVPAAWKVAEGVCSLLHALQMDAG